MCKAVISDDGFFVRQADALVIAEPEKIRHPIAAKRDGFSFIGVYCVEKELVAHVAY